jgi:hypothetical protein
MSRVRGMWMWMGGEGGFELDWERGEWVDG